LNQRDFRDRQREGKEKQRKAKRAKAPAGHHSLAAAHWDSQAHRSFWVPQQHRLGTTLHMFQETMMPTMTLTVMMAWGQEMVSETTAQWLIKFLSTL
jgi:hypothetical protein